MFGSPISQPKQPKKLANIDADQVATNQQAVPVPYLAGRQRVPLHFIAPVYNQTSKKITTTTGKDETSTIGYTYFGDIAGVVCMGGRAKVNRLYRHILDSEIVWEGSLAADADPYEPVTIEDFGLTRFYWGTPTQPIDDLVLEPIGPYPDPGTYPDFNPRDTRSWPAGNQTANLP